MQVITEFDGPLGPYVLDFAIEIGDVFDLLLRHTRGTQRLVPIAQHPGEFLAFVEKHNTVTVPPGLHFPDWPLYAAYPEQTLLDIAGPRSDLPIAKADRWATAVAREDVQGNILMGYRAERVKHFVLRVLDAAKARTWLAGKATPDDRPTAGVPQVMSFKPWLPGTKPNLMLNIGLTYAGMEALGIRETWRATFPEAFKQGALKRANDNFDFDSNAPDHWWLGGPGQERDIHVMVSLYHAQGAGLEFDKAVRALSDSLPDAGLQLLAEHDAVYHGGRNWFGYVDGISNPRIATACPVPDEHRDLQPAATAGEFVLGAVYRNVYGGNSLGALPAALATNGSFCAVRVLAQDTKAFFSALEAEAARLSQETGLKVTPDWLAAKLMGRRYEGAPLSLYPDVEQPTNPGDNERNDFDYAPSYEYPNTLMDHAGERCPVGAHIRRSNPRTARVAGARYARRLMRRGMHYEIKDAKGQRVEAGLFGLFICADLERQFEFIQRQWINGDRFAAGLRGSRDPLVGTPREPCDAFEIPMQKGSPLIARLPQFVQTKGSLYLFMPGLSALSQLERFATADRASPAGRALAPPGARTAKNQPATIAAVMGRLPKVMKPLNSRLAKTDLWAIALASVGTPKVAARNGSLTKSPASPRLRFDPRRRDFLIDPYPVYAAFRASEPVHYSPLFDGWFVFAYDDVVRVCTEDNNFSASPLNGAGPRGLFTLDEPEHGKVRQRVANAWRKAAGETPGLVQRSIDRTLAAIGTRSFPCFDLVDDFARPVPRDVYFDILGGNGIDAKERLELDALARTVRKHHDHTLDYLERWDGTLAGLELAARLAWMLAKAAWARSRYAGTFLAYFAKEVEWHGGTLSPAVAVMTLVNLTVAGYMSVEFLLATAIRRLLLDPVAGWDAVKKNPLTVPLFLEEMRRTDHALSVIDRFAKQDVVVNGVRIPSGARVFGVLASANRDERVFGSDADKFDPYRNFPKPHLGLGWGTHECMGRALERSITEPAICRLAAAMPDLILQSAAQPPWFENFYFRSFDHLPVTLK
ncbi:MAG: cytochrome P450 [Pseudomonadota bacterium]|nr:cytochrome P450 [Pseudomonadota bacterium]